MEKCNEVVDAILDMRSNDIIYIFNRIILEEKLSKEELEDLAKSILDLIKEDYSVDMYEYLSNLL